MISQESLERPDGFGQADLGGGRDRVLASLHAFVAGQEQDSASANFCSAAVGSVLRSAAACTASATPNPDGAGFADQQALAEEPLRVGGILLLEQVQAVCGQLPGVLRRAGPGFLLRGGG